MSATTTAPDRLRVEPGQKRVRAFLDGHLVVDTISPLLVWESPYYPTYYLPLADVRAELVASGETSRSPSRGEGLIHDVQVASRVAPAAALTYPDSAIEELRDRVRLDWDAMSAWFEEDEEVFTHPRSPTTRIDILPTSRHVQVLAGPGGETVLAESTRAHVLFETMLPPRWYLPKLDVRMDLLQPSDTVTHCPYKGTPVHYATKLGGELVDVAWSYPAPLRESQRIAGLVAFYDDRVRVLVDGQPTRQE
jgi:uncharacterized protein (DUF427 family)